MEVEGGPRSKKRKSKANDLEGDNWEAIFGEI